jgi:aspartate/methionine/tyrosine aminotransferase
MTMPLGQIGAGLEGGILGRLLSMKIRPFRIEEYFAKYEFSAKYLMGSSDMESREVRELFALEPGAQEKFLGQWCGYTESAGAPELRETVAGIYKDIAPENTFIISCAEEAIFVLYHALVGADDHVIVEAPCYESGLEVARSTGAAVSEWRRRGEDGWAHDVAALRKLIQPNTNAMYINTPHNPTGLIMPRGVFDEVMQIAREHNIIVICDEVYRELEHDPAMRLPAGCEVNENAVSLGSMSKTYGLAGLRLGWLVTRDPKIIQKCLDFRYYTTISNSAPSEFLSALALRHRDVLVKRNLEIVHRNLALLSAFFEKRGELFSWVKPNGSPIGFVKFGGKGGALEFCEDLVQKAGVMLLPGTVYDEPKYMRFGYGRKNMPEALGKLEEYLQVGA